MKRWMGVLLGVSMLLLGWSTFRSADASEASCGRSAEQIKVVARGGAGRAFIAIDDMGELAFLDPQTNETIVPLRPFFTILADAGAVQWDESIRTARFYYGTHVLSLQLSADGDQVTSSLDGHPYPLRAQLCDGRLQAPLRGVTGALGLELRWYESDQTAVIDPVWTTGVLPPVQEPESPPPSKRPASCESVEEVGWSDFWLNPFSAWDRTLQRTACALVI